MFKKIILAILFNIVLGVSVFSASEEIKESNKNESFVDKVDEQFGDATGWFIEAVMYKIPFTSDVKEEFFGSNHEIDSLKSNKVDIIEESGKIYIVKSRGVQIPWVLIILILAGISLTIYFKFVNIRHFFTSIKIISGKYDELEGKEHIESAPIFPSDDIDNSNNDNRETIRLEGEHHGEVSHFQALTAALSGTVGLGNIAGVAVAISIGGPGATFWMIVAGLFGMTLKFAECTLGVMYRDIDENGIVYGGPMYYLSKGLKGYTGKILAVIFSILAIGGSFGGGNMFQANQAFEQFSNVTNLGNSEYSSLIFGVIMAFFVAIVIIGGIKSIANVTDKIVPLMIVVYILACLTVVFVNFNSIPTAISLIFEGAFKPVGIAGGFLGVLLAGFQRAAFSNEAGVGSAPIAHSAVKTKFPASEGLVSLLEPFIDTVVICTMTALMIIVVDINHDIIDYGTKIDKGVILTSNAITSYAPFAWFDWVLMIAVILFAFSTMISWSYYGFQAWSYLFGRNKSIQLIYKIIFILFVILGANLKLGSVIDFSDTMILAMLVPNMIGVIFLLPKIKTSVAEYLIKIKNHKNQIN